MKGNSCSLSVRQICDAYFYLVSLVLSCIWALMGHTLFSWLTDNPEIIRLGTIILFIDVILEVGRAINIYATNALRATGDVNYPFYVGFVVQWSVAVGCGFLFGIHWGWGLVGMWCAFVLDEIFVVLSLYSVGTV